MTTTTHSSEDPGQDPGQDPVSEAAALRERLSRLSQASLRINESLDLDTVLQGVLDSARALAGARYGVLAVLPGLDSMDGMSGPEGLPRLPDVPDVPGQDSVPAPGQAGALLASGLTPDQFRGLQEIPGGEDIFRYLGSLPGPLRVADLSAHAAALGLPGFLPPMPVRAFLAVPILRLGDVVGYIYVAHSEADREFSVEDEETLVTFAAQAALVIANARRHREEGRARAGLETLVNTSPVGVVVFDVRTGRPVSFNREALRIVDGLRSPGQSPEELLNTLTIRRADGREDPLSELPLARLMSAGETVRAEEITLIAPDGRTVSTLLNATPIRSPIGPPADAQAGQNNGNENAAGAPAGTVRDGVAGDGMVRGGEVESYVATVQDLTELEDLGRLRAEFLGMVSHRLRAPLAAVKGSVTTLLESGVELDPAETRQFHRIIRDQADRMRRLIGDLLDVARIETGTLVVSPSPEGVAELVEDATRRFAGGGGRSSVVVETDLALGLPPVLSDSWRMAQALGHLLSHVAARLPMGPAIIRVSAVREGLHVALSVAAQGREHENGEAPRRLAEFPSGDGEDRSDDAGLGLSICKGIVEAHGGRLRVEHGGAGIGTVFTVTLPAAHWQATGTAPAAPTTGAAPRSAPAPAGSRGSARDRLRVLAVDDPQALRHLRDALWNAGFFPIATGDPEDVLRLVEEEKPQLVLLDAALPGYDGPPPELLRAIMVAADAPVILLTTPGQEDAMAHALDLGVSDYLVRPFSPSELAARINAALRRHAEPHLAAPSQTYVLGNLTIDYAQRRVSLAGSVVTLTPNEYGLLAELAMNAGRTLTHDHLLQRVWSPGRMGQRWLLREVVKRLRGKLGDDASNPSYIFLQRGVGYRMGPAREEEEG